MAASGGRLLQKLAENAKLLKEAWQTAKNVVEGRLQPLLRPEAEAIPLRVTQPLHPVARIRQNAASKRWYTTRAVLRRTQEQLRGFKTIVETHSSPAPGFKYNRANLPISKTATIVNSLPGRSPFAHTLRPNLTGGTLNRTAGGYTLGGGRIGGARYFSHGPASPANVVNNVSQAVRAFWLSGSKAQYDGIDKRTGSKRYRTVSDTKYKVMGKISGLPKATPGSHVDFRINPTITALASLNGVAGYRATETESYGFETQDHLNTSGLLDVLHTDFSRSLTDLAAILSDLKRLASLGDLPITYESGHSGPSLRIHFPGTDAETVERLCEEMNITRGVVTQDPGFDSFVGSDIALMFPFAPSKPASIIYEDDGVFSLPLGKTWEHCRTRAYEDQQSEEQQIDWRNMMTPEDYSEASEHELEQEYEYEHADISSTPSEQDLEMLDHAGYEDANPWLSSPEGYGSAASGSRMSVHKQDSEGLPLEYQDFEGIRNFLLLCDDTVPGGGRITSS